MLILHECSGPRSVWDCNRVAWKNSAYRFRHNHGSGGHIFVLILDLCCRYGGNTQNYVFSSYLKGLMLNPPLTLWLKREGRKCLAQGLNPQSSQSHIHSQQCSTETSPGWLRFREFHWTTVSPGWSWGRPHVGECWSEPPSAAGWMDLPGAGACASPQSELKITQCE